jgi:hypothetical protein
MALAMPRTGLTNKTSVHSRPQRQAADSFGLIADIPQSFGHERQVADMVLGELGAAQLGKGLRALGSPAR